MPCTPVGAQRRISRGRPAGPTRVGCRGLAPRSSVLQTDATLRLAHSPIREHCTPDRIRTDVLRLKDGDPDLSMTGASRESTLGVEPDHTAYEAGARPSRSMGTIARGSARAGISSVGAPRSRTVLACVCTRELQWEESNPRDDRLTAGCLTIRLRWNEWLARKERDEPSGAKFSESMAARGLPHAWLGSGRRSRTCVSGFRDQRPAS